MLALTAGTVIDGLGSSPRRNATIVIEGHRIVEIGEATEFGSEVDIVDLEGRTVLPGLIDCHIHFGLMASELLSKQSERIGLLAARTVNALAATLAAGCTTARDLGGLDAGFRDGLAERVIRGPRILTSVVMIGPTNGMDDPTTTQGSLSLRVPWLSNSVADGAAQVRARVREALRYGADVVKIGVTGGASVPRIGPYQQLFCRDEIEAAVDEAHRAGVRVACHALGGPGLMTAVESGVDSIEHGCDLDEAAAREMADRGTWYVPTMAAYELHSERGPADVRERASRMHELHVRSLDRARRAGVRIAMGSDAGNYGEFAFSRELDALVRAGMSPMDAILAGTRWAAECLGLEGSTGSIEAGKDADLIVLEAGDPLADITALSRSSNIRMVFQRGRLVAERPA
jgi:imidazolonepropionase-like amidohydrolase